MKLLNRLQLFSYASDEEYRGDTTAVSSHFLMSFLDNDFTKEDVYGYKPYFAQGHLLELLIHEGDFSDILEKEFKILEFEPTGILQTLISLYANEGFMHNMRSRDEQKEALLKLIRDHSLWLNTKKENLLLEKFDYDVFWEYLDNMFADKPKKILSTEQYNVIENAADRIKSMPFMVQLRQDIKEDKAFAFIHPMYKVESRIEGYLFTAKIQLDLLVYYPEENKIIIVDFKTTSNKAGKFGIDYKKYKLFLQSFWYTTVLSQVVNHKLDIEFYFAVVSKTSQDEKALLIKDDLIESNTLFDKTSLFYYLNRALNVKGLTLEEIMYNNNSPMALLNDFQPSISQLL